MPFQFLPSKKINKPILIWILLVQFFLTTVQAQVPQAIPYQAVARDSSGAVIANQLISLQFSIHDVTDTGTVVYQETQTVSTNSLGLFSVSLGEGVPVSGVFSSIPWATGAKFLEVGMDANGGSNYLSMGTTKLNSVPYALYAENSNGWTTTGNAGTDPMVNSLGTNDDKDLVIKTDSNETARFYSNPESDGSLHIPTDRLRLMRTGAAYQKWPMVASFQLGSYEANLEGRTQLDIALLNGPGVNPDNKVMSLLANGNVGIGNTTPTEKLDVNGTGKFGPYLKIGTDVLEGYFQNSQDGAYRALQAGGDQGYWFQNYAGTNTAMYIGLNGAFQNHVGIGNTTPQHRLSVGDPSGDQQPVAVRGFSNDGTWKGGAAFGYTAGSVMMGELFGVPTIGGHNANLSAWNDLAINPVGGNVGIGTQTPVAKLDVVGNVKISDGSEGAGKVLTSDANGNASWVSSASETDPKVGTLNLFKVPKWNGTTLQDGLISDNGTNIGIGTGNPYATMHIMSPNSKNDTNLHDIEVLTSNETDYPYQLSIGMKGSGDLHTRNFYFQTLEHNLYLDGNLSMQPYGGKMVVGAELGQHLFQVGGGTDDKQGVNMRSYSNAQPNWKGGAAFGYNQGSVIMGELEGVPTIGGHNGDLSAWNNLSINPGGGNVGIGTLDPKSFLHINNPNGPTTVTIGGNPEYGGNTVLSIGVSQPNNGYAKIQGIAASGSTWGNVVMNKEGGNVIVGDDSDVPSAKLQINSHTQGLLPPRMTALERNAIVNPAAGLVLFCSDCSTNGQLQTYNGSSWMGAASIADGVNYGDMQFWNGTSWEPIAAGIQGQYLQAGVNGKPVWTGNSLPKIQTNPASNVTSNSATLGWTFIVDGGLSQQGFGICYSDTTSNPNLGNSTVYIKPGSNAPLGNLYNNFFNYPSNGSSNFTILPNKKYYFRAWSKNSFGTAYGAVDSFSTLPPAVPTITTSNAIASPTLAGEGMSGGNVTSNNGAPVTSRGICWSTSPNPSLSDNVVLSGTGNGTFVATITGLSGTTMYYVRAFATNSAGTAYGDEKSFANVPAGNATIVTNTPYYIAATGANIGGTITQTGRSQVLAKGICWSTTADPTLLNSNSLSTDNAMTFSATAATLTMYTTYHCRAYVTTEVGTFYGNDIVFKAQPNIGNNYQGGMIFYIFQPGDAGYVAGQVHGLIAAPNDVGFLPFQNCAGSCNYYLGYTSGAIGNGPFNTSWIVAHIGNSNNTNYAAKACNDYVNDGYSDWYLPSFNELIKLCDRRNIIAGLTLGNGNAGWPNPTPTNYWENVYHASLDGTYWSSTETNSNFAKTVEFTWWSSMPLKDRSKEQYSHVRPIRSF